jgi:hypothetical protein
MAISRVKHSRRKGNPQRPDEAPSPAQIDVFFRVYAETFSEYAARTAEGAKLKRAQLARLKEDPEFMKRWMEILGEDDKDDQLEAAAMRKAIVGGDKDMQMFLLKGRKPHIYGNRATVQMNLTPEQLAAMSDEQLHDLHRKLAGKR